MDAKFEPLQRASTGIAGLDHVLGGGRARDRLRRASSVVKKRTGPHEDTIREFNFSNKGLTLGAPLEALQGMPAYVGMSSPLAEVP